MKAQIVLGAGYGDEGKGRVVDSLCGLDRNLSVRNNKMVVRFSGGQQAGHNVVYNGIQHIHSNYGAGTLRGIPTYFTEHTTIYLNNIAKEHKILKEKGIDVPQLYIHPLARITTPYDIHANRRDKDNLEHGTCGLGVGKTMERHEKHNYKLYAIDLMNKRVFCEKLDAIKKFYDLVPTPDLQKDVTLFISNLYSEHDPLIKIADYGSLLSCDTLIFEGSQGILLDKDYGVFPHVTYANTTSKNALEVINHFGIKNSDIETFYVTRCYHTRHGNGPFHPESIDPSVFNLKDDHNEYNKYQKNFKVAKFDYSLFAHALRYDDIENTSTNKTAVVTCLDHIPDNDSLFDADKLLSGNPELGRLLLSSSVSGGLMTYIKHTIELEKNGSN